MLWMAQKRDNSGRVRDLKTLMVVFIFRLEWLRMGTVLLMTQVSPLAVHSLHQRKKKHNLIAKVYFTKVSK